MVRKSTHTQAPVAKAARPNSFNKTRKLTICALFIALEMILAFTPLGMIPVAGLSITLMNIPVLIAILMEGWAVGGVVAFSFGAISLYKSLTSMGFFDQLFRNPLIAILPRLMVVPAVMGAFTLTCWLVSRRRAKRGIEKRGAPRVAYAMAAGVGSLANTVFTLGALSLNIWISPAALGLMPDAAAATIASMWLTSILNAGAECAACVIVVTGISYALNRIKK